jgi:hypothetical protein
MNMFPCPSASAIQAQVWFELRSGGLRVLAYGTGTAMVLYLLFTLAGPFFPFRPFAMIGVFGVAPAALLLLTRNAFGIRREKKRAYLSAFEATQPIGTAQMAGVKLLVRAACVLAVMAMIGLSVWASLSLLSEWGPWVTKKGNDMRMPMQQLLGDLADRFEGPWYGLVAHAYNVSFLILGLVTTFATFVALWARYSRGVVIWSSLLVLAGLALAIGFRSEALPQSMSVAIPWLVDAALVITIVYVLKSGFAERALTIPYVCAAVALSIANLVAYLPENVPPPGIGETFRQVLLPLLIFVLAPWSLSRIRHT